MSLLVRKITYCALSSAALALLATVFLQHHPLIIIGLLTAHLILTWYGWRQLIVSNKNQQDAIRKLEEENACLRAALDQIPTGVCITDEKLQIPYWNAGFPQIFGIEETALKANNSMSVLFRHAVQRGDDGIGEVEEQIAARQAQVLGFARYDLERNLFDGRCIHESARPVYAAGRLLAYIMIYQDVTAQKEADMKLAASARKFASVFHTMPEGLIISRAMDGTVVEVNEGFEHLTGWSRTEVMGHTTASIGLWRTPAERQKFLTALASQDSLRAYETDLGRKDGAVWRAAVSAAMTGIDGEAMIVSVLHDVTQLRQREAQLRASEGRLAGMFRAFPEFLTVSLLSNGKLIEVNEGFERITGWPRAQALGHSILELGIFTPEQRARLVALLQERGGVIRDMDYQMRHKDGRMVHVSWSGAIFDLDGVPHMVAIARDVTEIRQQELALRNSLAAQQAAEVASQMKSEFLAMISHEVRTPLGGVIGMLRFGLKDKQLSNSTRAKLSVGLSNAEVLLQIINDILDYSKLEAGKMTIEELDFDLPNLVRDVAAILVDRAEAKSLSLILEMPTTLQQWWRGDPTRLRQVLVNLIGNAIKFTEQGEVKLSVAINQQDHIEFTIADTGIGITSDALARLFQKFEQADVSTARKFGGTGLGLAISRRIVQAMGGEIQISSQVGTGTTARFWLALQAGTAPNLDLPNQATREHSHQLKVLCAEDGTTNQIIIRELVQAMGHRIDIAEDGQLALEALAATDYDLVLMDSRMPRMDGIAALRCIRQAQHGVRDADIPVIALTANVGDEERQRFLAAGANGFLGKPVDEFALQAEIGHMITLLLERGHSLAPRTLSSTAASGDIAALDALFGVDTAHLPELTPAASNFTAGGTGPNEQFLAAQGFSPQARQAMAQAFMQETPRLQAAIHQALAANDLRTLALHAHSIKGSAGYFGATELQAVCYRLEQAADQADLAEILRKIDEFDQAVVRALRMENTSSV